MYFSLFLISNLYDDYRSRVIPGQWDTSNGFGYIDTEVTEKEVEEFRWNMKIN